MATNLSDAGVQLASGNLIDLKTTMPSTGSYTAGDIVLESTTGVALSGWKRLTTGSSHVLNTDWKYFFDGIQQGTVVNTTSGTTIDLSTAIPSWVKRITINFKGVSLSGTSFVVVQLGSGTYTTTGYTGAGTLYGGVNSVTGIAATTIGLHTAIGSAAANICSGVFTLVNQTGNSWVSSSLVAYDGLTSCGSAAGNIALGGTLDRVRITTLNGTDTFDAGSVNIMWE